MSALPPFTWQDGVFKAAAGVLCVTSLLLVGSVLWVFSLEGSSEAEGGDLFVFAKVITLSSLCVSLVAVGGLFKERQALGERLPHVTPVRTIIAVLGLLFFVPLLHIGFLVGAALITLCAMSTFSREQLRICGVAVCDAAISFFLVEMMRRGGGWDWNAATGQAGAQKTAKFLIGSYAWTTGFFPLCIVLVTTRQLPTMAKLLEMVYGFFAMHAAVIALVSANIYLEERFQNASVGDGGKGCVRSVVPSGFGVMLWIFSAVNRRGKYDGPQTPGKTPEPCRQMTENLISTVETKEISVGTSGKDAIVVFILMGVYCFSLMAAIIVCPPGSKVAPDQVITGDQSDMSFNARSRRHFKRCLDVLKKLGKGGARLVCILSFIAGAIVLGVLFSVVVLAPSLSDNGDDADRRLSPLATEPLPWPSEQLVSAWVARSEHPNNRSQSPSLTEASSDPLFLRTAETSRAFGFHRRMVENNSNNSNNSNATNNSMCRISDSSNSSGSNNSEFNNSSGENNSRLVRCDSLLPVTIEGTMQYFLGGAGGNMTVVYECADETWCGEDIVDPLLGMRSNPRCELAACSTCEFCLPPCPPPKPPEVQRVAVSSVGLAVAKTVLFGWAALPSVQIQATWCETGALAPTLFALLLFICRCYVMSLISVVAAKQAEKRQMEAREEIRKRSKELGYDVEMKRKQKTSTGLTLIDLTPPASMPDPKTVCSNDRRIFGV
eukprot:TRINITY_DN4200_c0_g1_i1.p1 TRINITY_DN4200_c0_g1~~TRINITY_DN4200_c0_g1_i1.p1  ORF type:complete len:720 (+),score=120.64 TRINITY_DN4200_c0_g1_i1:202-2361(+)